MNPYGNFVDNIVQRENFKYQITIQIHFNLRGIKCLHNERYRIKEPMIAKHFKSEILYKEDINIITFFIVN